jgi:hypothetical protein
MVRMVLLLVAAVLLLGSCAGSVSESRRSDPISQASMCAMCGGSVSPGYFDYSAQRTTGPGQGW